MFCSAEEQDDIIPIHDYLVRIYELIGCEGEHYVIAPFAYICRLQTTHVFRLTLRNVHRHGFLHFCFNFLTNNFPFADLCLM